MGNPRWSYDSMCYRAYYYFNKKEPESITEAEWFLKEYKDKDPTFYFGCGCAAGQVVEEIASNDVCDGINAMAGGLWLFKDLIEVKNHD